MHTAALLARIARASFAEVSNETRNIMLKEICSLVVLAAALLAPSARGSEMFLATDDVGQTWLQIVGAIEDGDDAKFRNMLLEAIDRGEQIAKVSIYSPRGRLDAALKNRRSPARAPAGASDLRYPCHERSNDRSAIRAAKTARRSTMHMRRRMLPDLGCRLRQAWRRR
jgi:hypothetical protein